MGIILSLDLGNFKTVTRWYDYLRPALPLPEVEAVLGDLSHTTAGSAMAPAASLGRMIFLASSDDDVYTLGLRHPQHAGELVGLRLAPCTSRQQES
jgi:hypothetical protein